MTQHEQIKHTEIWFVSGEKKKNYAPWEELAFLSATYNRANLVRFQDGVLGDL